MCAVDMIEKPSSIYDMFSKKQYFPAAVKNTLYELDIAQMTICTIEISKANGSEL